MGGGTEAFPELGRHCQHADCNQLDFLPFTCNACQKMFCLEHRSFKSHDCPKMDHDSRRVVVCETCSTAIEMTGRSHEEEKVLLEKHDKSGDCDPKKKKKPRCPAKRCKEVLTFSNNSTCKICQLKVCLKHRFPADHACENVAMGSSKMSVALGAADRSFNGRFLVALASRSRKDCAKTGNRPKSPQEIPTSVRAH